MEQGLEVLIRVSLHLVDCASAMLPQAHFNGELRKFNVPSTSSSILQFHSRLEDVWGRSAVSQCRIRYQQANTTVYITTDDALRSLLRGQEAQQGVELVLEPSPAKGINASAAPFVPRGAR